MIAVLRRSWGLRRVRGLAWIALAWFGLQGVAAAEDPLAQARRSVAESDYGAARPALIAALDAGGRGPDELVEIYRLTRIVEAALGNARGASDAFIHLLVLSPRATLPDGTSPKITRPFDAAARWVASHGALEVKLDSRASPPALALVVVSDPLNMVATARAVFTVDGAERSADVEVGTERTSVAVPAGQRIDARIAALDVHGNCLAELGSREAPVVIVGEPPPVVAPPAPPPPRAPVVHAAARPIYLRWWPYAAAGALALGATTYFGLAARSETDELNRLIAGSAQHGFGEASAVEDRARRDVLLTNIGLGVTGALAIAAGVLYLTAPRDVEARVAIVPLAGGGALVLGGKL